jgi:hypothetical protein
MLHKLLSENEYFITNFKEELRTLKKHEHIYESKLDLINKLSNTVESGKTFSLAAIRRQIASIYELNTKELDLEKFEEKEITITLRTIKNGMFDAGFRKELLNDMNKKLIILKKNLRKQFVWIKSFYQQRKDISSDDYYVLKDLVVEEAKILFNIDKEGVAGIYKIYKDIGYRDPTGQIVLYHAYPGEIKHHELLYGGLINRFKCYKGFYMATREEIAIKRGNIDIDEKTVKLLKISMTKYLFEKLLQRKILRKQGGDLGIEFMVPKNKFYYFNLYIMNKRINIELF